jgi:hypothetical protein
MEGLTEKESSRDFLHGNLAEISRSDCRVQRPGDTAGELVDVIDNRTRVSHSQHKTSGNIENHME